MSYRIEVAPGVTLNRPPAVDMYWRRATARRPILKGEANPGTSIGFLAVVAVFTVAMVAMFLL